MKNYLKSFSYGFITAALYYVFNLFMVLINLIFYTSAHDKIYGTFDVPRNPNTIMSFFITICAAYAFVLLGFFLFGRKSNLCEKNILLSFIVFMIPNFLIQILIYYSYSVELICLLNWFLKPLGDVFFFKTQTAYDLSFSYLGNSLLTYLPFIFTFLGALSGGQGTVLCPD